MPVTTERALDWVGHCVDDVHGRAVGHVAGVVVDRADGAPLYLLVRLRTRARHVVVPLDGAIAGAGHVMVPWAGELLRGLPGVPADGGLAARTEALARGPFGARLAPRDVGTWDHRRSTGLAFRAADGTIGRSPGPRTPVTWEHPAARPLTSVAVVDDCAGFCALVAAVLTPPCGFRVDAQLHDGAMALDHLLDAPPDLVVLDLVLPGLDGLSVVAELTATTASRVLLVSGHDGLAPMVHARLGERGRFLRKAEGPDALLRAARDLVGAPPLAAA